MRAVSACGTDAAKALEISDALLDNPQHSECWRRCPDDCSALEVDAALVGDVSQPKADQRRTITLLSKAYLSHSTVNIQGYHGEEYFLWINERGKLQSLEELNWGSPERKYILFLSAFN